MPEAPKTTQKATDYSLELKNKKTLEFIEDVTSNADEVQKKVLGEILARNAHVEYLQAHGLNGRTDRESFKKTMPVITYEDIQHHVERIANGDASPILCSKPISEFLTSSGTSGGERKLMPTIEEELGRRSLLYSLLMPVMSQFVPGLDKGKGMYFLFIKFEAKTPGGLVALWHTLFSLAITKATISKIGHMTLTQTTPAQMRPFFVPIPTKACTLKCFVDFANTRKSSGTGTLDSQITDQSVREAVMKILKPDPRLADFIEAECSKRSWQGIITKLWPNTKYVDVIVTGTMSQYIPTLDYYSNGLPLVCTMYAYSECYFGVNLNPLCKPSEVSYTLMPTMAYFEFFPVQRNNGVTNSISVPKSLNEKERQELVDLVDVKLGQEYELVVTTYSDFIVIESAMKNVVLCIDSDKTDEVELQNAVKNAVNHLLPFDATLAEYTSYADTITIPGHYVLYWELSLNGTTPIPPSVFEDCCLTIEESLNSVYRQGRVCDKSIGPLEIKIVEPGTFDKLMDYAISLGASINQYKTPRCVKFVPIVELLNSRAVSSYFSPKCPKWFPGHKQWGNKN
ncbi:Gretchen Hagen3.6, DWARF IN LIGHT 1 [Hibiscus trionum]|uniref:Gretchen Hagen3.6, DWARF IN LIGHT 1 n=1 Tax=Hibiscus trionum TaxID=183268 RepID=A0A9W7JCD3_HIBTR|nr:Gretchen Hagen3.6, DWARF IN LIGHT 1 [Hibiscus trionum]